MFAERGFPKGKVSMPTEPESEESKTKRNAVGRVFNYTVEVNL